MSSNNRVLLVDDHVGDITWLIDFLEARGYEVDQVTNEMAARRKLKRIKEDLAKNLRTYELAIIDIMVSTRDIMELVALTNDFYEKSKETGIRLCQYARDDLKISAKRLPIVCISARPDTDDFQPKLEELGIRLFSRTPQTAEESIRDYLERALPSIG